MEKLSDQIEIYECRFLDGYWGVLYGGPKNLNQTKGKITLQSIRRFEFGHTRKAVRDELNLWAQALK